MLVKIVFDVEIEKKYTACIPTCVKQQLVFYLRFFLTYFDNGNSDNLEKMSNEEFITKSKLGEKEYWNHFYEEELTNFKDYGDEGETWFGIRNSKKIIDWIDKNIDKNGLFLFVI